MFPTSTRMRKTIAARKRKEVEREKMRRVRVAALIVRGEGPPTSLGESANEGAVSFSWCDLRWRLEEVNRGSTIVKQGEFWGSEGKRIE